MIGFLNFFSIKWFLSPERGLYIVKTKDCNLPQIVELVNSSHKSLRGLAMVLFMASPSQWPVLTCVYSNEVFTYSKLPYIFSVGALETS